MVVRNSELVLKDRFSGAAWPIGLLGGLFLKPNSELNTRAMLGTTPHRMAAGGLAGLRIPGARVQGVIANQESNISHTFVKVNFRDHC